MATKRQIGRKLTDDRLAKMRLKHAADRLQVLQRRMRRAGDNPVAKQMIREEINAEYQRIYNDRKAIGFYDKKPLTPAI